MIKKYLVELTDKKQTYFTRLNMVGNITYTSDNSNILILEMNEKYFKMVERQDFVINIKENEIGHLC